MKNLSPEGSQLGRREFLKRAFLTGGSLLLGGSNMMSEIEKKIRKISAMDDTEISKDVRAKTAEEIEKIQDELDEVELRIAYLTDEEREQFFKRMSEFDDIASDNKRGVPLELDGKPGGRGARERKLYGETLKEGWIRTKDYFESGKLLLQASRGGDGFDQKFVEEYKNELLGFGYFTYNTYSYISASNLKNIFKEYPQEFVSIAKFYPRVFELFKDGDRRGHDGENFLEIFKKDPENFVTIIRQAKKQNLSTAELSRKLLPD